MATAILANSGSHHHTITPSTPSHHFQISNHSLTFVELPNFYTTMEDQLIQNEDFSSQRLPSKRYDNCRFEHCNFEKADLSNVQFIECTFNQCNWSNVAVHNTALKDVKFENCKLLGVNFNDCNDFLLAISFEKCSLNLASFYQMKLPSIQFLDCEMHETDFSEANLTKATFDYCDLKRAIFDHTTLEKANFLTAKNFSIHPEHNKITNAIFSKEGALGLLDSYKIVIQ